MSGSPKISRRKSADASFRLFILFLDRQEISRRRETVPFLSCLELFLVVPGDTLVTLRQRRELLAADHIVDVRERLVTGTAVDLLQDRIGWRTTVREYHIACRRQALILVSLERGDRIGF